MNWIGFVRLIRSIYGKDLPDLQRIQDQGLLAVKIAQVFALRIDFLNREKCQHLARLYRHTVEIPAEGMRRLLRQYTDSSFAGHFGSIDDSALASAFRVPPQAGFPRRAHSQGVVMNSSRPGGTQTACRSNPRSGTRLGSETMGFKIKT